MKEGEVVLKLKLQNVLMAATMAVTMGSAAFAGALDTPVTYTPAPNITKFRQRVDHIKNQTEKAQSEGWITSEQASKFMEDYNRLDGKEKELQSAKSYSDEDRVAMEKDVTAVHHNLHLAIAEGKK